MGVRKTIRNTLNTAGAAAGLAADVALIALSPGFLFAAPIFSDMGGKLGDAVVGKDGEKKARKRKAALKKVKKTAKRKSRKRVKKAK